MLKRPGWNAARTPRDPVLSPPDRTPRFRACRSIRAWPGRVASALLLGSLALPGTMLAAGQTEPEGPVWEEAIGLQVTAGDSIVAEARIFDSPDYQSQLVVGPDGSGWVLSLVDQGVAVLPAEAISWTEDELPIPDPSASSDGGLFQNDDGILTFAAGDGTWSVRPEPPLIGAVSVEKLRRAKPEYFHAARKYRPDATTVAALRTVERETEISVFFGTWCLYCKKYLPRLLKTIEEAGNPRLHLSFYGVNEDQTEPADALRRLGVSATPTFLILQDGREVGRIEEEPDVSVESDLAYILGVG